ncbi:zinc-ribbon domain-containing protein [Curtobacterium sp. VKM Ac-1376]|nr:zinc-ribbon domain-containing protein [Curtobacterium sp. VKM Ac-1376]
MKNDDAPADVLLYSKEPRWFICSGCGHGWATRPAYRTSGHGCPACRRQRAAATKRTPKPGASLAVVPREVVNTV